MSKKFFIIVLSLLLIGIVFLPSKVFAGHKLCFDCATNSQANGGRGGVALTSTTTGKTVPYVFDLDIRTCDQFLRACSTCMALDGWHVEGLEHNPVTKKSWICVDHDANGKDPGKGSINGFHSTGLKAPSIKERPKPQPDPPKKPDPYKTPDVQPGDIPQGGKIEYIIMKDTDEVKIEVPTYAEELPDSINRRIRTALELRGIEYTDGIGGYPIHPTFDSLVYLPSLIIWEDSLGRRPDGLIHVVTDPGISISGVTTVPLEEDIPTLTEWGLIIFGVMLIGFITWVFLKRRRAEEVSVVES